ncbi:MAG: aldehyde dehydrogenase family protein [Nitrosospira sp.]|nr:aldehyde dehydrogenase family protein [Nitrosospira sp.]
MKGTSTIPATQPSPTRYTGFDSMPIAGRWRKGRSQRQIEDVDPYRGDILVSITGANADDVDEAYKKAAEAGRDWAAATPQARRDVLLRAAEILIERKEEIAELLIRETGGTRAKAETEWSLVYEGTLEASTYPFRMKGEILPTGIPGKEGRVYRQPVGVVGVISPWDFSLQLTNRSVAPALATGNAVVLKPASTTPITGGLLFAKIYEEAGLPPGVLSVVVGGGSEIGDAFVEHPIPRVITFTGSTEVGRHIGELCGKYLKRAALELGGNTPFIVLEDADQDLAVNVAVFGKFLNAGQICMAINRIIVDKKIHDEFLERFTERVKALKWGDPAQGDTDMGPIIERKQFDNIRTLVDETIKAGARVVLDGPSQGLVMHPVILAEVTNDMPAARNEIFGPVAPIIKADGEEEAIRIANDTEYGLSSAICTRDLEKGVALAKRIEAGMTHVNDIPINDVANSPFGGVKQSGIGRFGGEWALREFTTEHWITIQQTPRQYPF